MKTLALSDFHWNRDSRDIKLSDTQTMTTSEILNHPNFSKVKFYFEIVTKNSPDLLLLCGDITGDGSCGHGYTSSVTAFLKLVEAKKIKTRYISGNHDESQYYDEIKRHFANSKYVRELTNKIEKIGDIKLIGLSWEQTRTKTSFRQLFTSEKVDIVVCHCDHGQRLNLFDYNTDFIITGHYDLKVINPNNKTFISLDNDAPQGTNFVTIENVSKEKEIIFSILKYGAKEWTQFKFTKSNKSFALKETNHKQSSFPSWDNLSYLNNVQFEKVIEKAHKTKIAGLKIPNIELEEILNVQINRHLKVSRKFINP
jgi:hypothetical protein